MRSVVLVALGGALGSVVRYGVGCWCMLHCGGMSFPIATLVVNGTGSLLIGFLMQCADGGRLHDDTKLLAVTGFLGGLTTFSTFAFETWRCNQSANLRLAWANVGANVILGLIAVAAGVELARWLMPSVRAS